MTVFQHETYLL